MDLAGGQEGEGGGGRLVTVVGLARRPARQQSRGPRLPSRGWEEDLVGGLQIATVAGYGGDRRGGPIGSGLGDNREGVVVTG